MLIIWLAFSRQIKILDVPQQHSFGVTASAHAWPSLVTGHNNRTPYRHKKIWRGRDQSISSVLSLIISVK